MKKILMITDKAIHQLHKIMNKNNSEYIRLHLNKRGCNGFSFSMNHTNLKDKNDELVEQNGVKVLIAPNVLLKIIGTEMDYITDRIKSEFVFTNPQSNGECGCGESFQIK